MNNNITYTQSGTPYLFQVEEPINSIKLNNLDLKLDTFYKSESPKLIFNPNQESMKLKQEMDGTTEVFFPTFNNPIEFIQHTPENIGILNENEDNCNYQIIYPEDLNLKRKPMKRGRPKKTVIDKPPEHPKTPTKGSRTRSGRLVKLPKHIEKDFKRIEISENDEIQTINFKRFEDVEEDKKFIPNELVIKKRVINNQYKCKKCFKAYLGKSKMINHLIKHPDHGPIPEYNQTDINLWNNLIDITKKSQPARRGVIFCNELRNLLNNLEIIKKVLFKKVNDNNKNVIEIDELLGNAIGLEPGKYKFNEDHLDTDLKILKFCNENEIFNNGNNLEETATALENINSKEVEDNLNNHQTTNDILTDNLLLNLPNNILDNSTSSDEVLNVDQFVNERFKNITENVDDDMGHSSLNLDLPTLELFQFNTS